MPAASGYRVGRGSSIPKGRCRSAKDLPKAAPAVSVWAVGRAARAVWVWAVAARAFPADAMGRADRRNGSELPLIHLLSENFRQPHQLQ